MKRAFLLLSFLASISFISSCVEPTEGCLDPFSSNYDLRADDECEDCCSYPNFTISTQYLYGEETIDSSIYYDIQADSYFKLRYFYLVLSDFNLYGDEGDYNLISKTPGKNISDDLLGVLFKNSSNTPGTIIIEDSIRSLDFKIGIPDVLDNPANADLDYAVLAFLQDSSFLNSIENRFYKLVVELEVDSVSNEVIRIGLDDLDFRFTSNVKAGTTRGNSMNVQLIIDFERLFNGVQFQSPSVLEDAKVILGQNIGTSIDVN